MRVAPPNGHPRRAVTSTHYQYDRPVALSPHVVRLRPAPHCRTPILSYSLSLTPRTHFVNWQQDPHGNYLARVVFPDKTERACASRSTWWPRWRCINPFDFFLEPCAETHPVRVRAGAAP